MILVIDNYDSFTYNLVQMIRVLTSEELLVLKNDNPQLKNPQALTPSALVISPGPGRPESAGYTKDMIQSFSGRVPILGVCLGLQCIAEVFSGQVNPSPTIKHGVKDLVIHTGDALFSGLPHNFYAVRYHSLAVDVSKCVELQVLASAPSDNTVMAVKHVKHPTYGLQFHPESYGTDDGEVILKNFLRLKEAFSGNRPITA
ncbi:MULTISPECIES: aminodeoxychorismate/anthranilate synthase component II [unclassified Fusibacter]|uniref:anthranilate synthase component II n=1 Tax=unclassified Fusibacter TaxID=2624464 RepID=UPI00101105EC|nr:MULTISPECIES: aminodeoxychorismate/anthranilate synthase component II [unclassified Fusibacter]MCK8061415.1 aminodeoxychorismate/anthranilate synthase component II [Fusibacter sp. A2]NPE23542.1 aminodeoxychorismate/anthranilate synthase component II [Fusibacter sp. A1]RXV58953.1 aminodeoxychorismate/anthranilate synthase component II [Fusibacter sp. A1]